MPDEAPQGRRAMFQLGFKRLFEPLAEFLEKRLDVPLPLDRTLLRPPGALAEKEFLTACYRCGNCVQVCPVKAIRPLSAPETEAANTPYIDPDLGACVLCEQLTCMSVCPSGALKRVDRVEIRMGKATVHQYMCLRNSAGQDCRICLEECPVGETAIAISDGGEVVVRDGCVGCGVCQFRCPTTPKAITVEPV